MVSDGGRVHRGDLGTAMMIHNSDLGKGDDSGGPTRCRAVVVSYGGARPGTSRKTWCVVVVQGGEQAGSARGRRRGRR
ncbi:hypothetical protein L1987_15708 [Smallanthus sonchifolius]|uniref:Uncharacterized protein n=1 Tax=Smallanthus sonchifolius TaxID=185202 RepID=A0ACB9J6C2_9ASTR|nr:hypothetical protein L1987_15708 [Smallanthus sonchifolius]